MLDLISDFHFIRPIWLLCFVALIIFIWVNKYTAKSSVNWTKFINQNLLKHISVSNQGKGISNPIKYLWLSLALAIVAVSGPTFSKKKTPSYENIIPTIIILDVSWSMNAVDIKPTRLEHAKIKINNWLKLHNGDKHAFIVYSGFANPVIPITFDSETITNLLPSISPEIMPSVGSKIEKAFELALEFVENANLTNANILVFTDGISKSSMDASYLLLKNNSIKTKIGIISISKKRAVVKYTNSNKFVHYSSQDSKKLLMADVDNGNTKKLANKLDGYFSKITIDNTDINDIHLYFNDGDLSNHKKNATKYDSWNDIGFWLLLFLIPIALLAFRRGILV
jgi:Ca-activated chloride channel family protein